LGERGAKRPAENGRGSPSPAPSWKDAPILILDEPTSSIDSRTEAVILDALDRLMVGRTTFMIAHRLSTIRRADLILVMDHGRLVETGTHTDLLDRGGLYKQLHDLQNRPRGGNCSRNWPPSTLTAEGRHECPQPAKESYCSA